MIHIEQGAPGVSKMLQQVRENVRGREEEMRFSQEHKSQWKHYGRKAFQYDDELGLPELTLQRFVEQRRKKGITPYVLDVGADPSAIRSLVAPGIAVGMYDGRSSEQKEDDAAKNIHMVEGDVLLPSTWGRVQEVMRQQEIHTGFSLVMSAADGGLQYITENPNVHGYILQQMWDVLSHDGGMLVAQTITRVKSEDRAKRLYFLPGFEELKKQKMITAWHNTPGMDARLLTCGIQLVRNQMAPDSLFSVDPHLAKQQIAPSRTLFSTREL